LHWIGFDLAKALSESLNKPVRVANDANIQGFDAISGHGVELVVTLGTGFRSALFVDGKLAPNLETAHHPSRRGESSTGSLPLRWLQRRAKNVSLAETCKTK
jgi:polyphosphate glucokinase